MLFRVGGVGGWVLSLGFTLGVGGFGVGVCGFVCDGFGVGGLCLWGGVGVG